AAKYMEALRKALPSTFIADAPWAYPYWHPGFPFAEFGRGVNARFPQLYWTEFGTKPATFHCPAVDHQWAMFNAAHPDAARPVQPIGVTYGHEHPSKPPGMFTLDDLRYFLDRYSARGALSLYSFEAMRASTRAFLETRAKAPTPR